MGSTGCIQAVLLDYFNHFGGLEGPQLFMGCRDNKQKSFFLEGGLEKIYFYLLSLGLSTHTSQSI